MKSSYLLAWYITNFVNHHPPQVHEFLPVIEVLSKTTSAFENVQEFFQAVCLAC